MSNNMEFGFTLKARDDGSLATTIEAARDRLNKLGAAGDVAGSQIYTGANKGREGIDASAKSIESLTGKLAVMGHMGAAMWGISKVTEYSNSVTEAVIKQQQFNNLMVVATGSAGAGATEYAKVKDIAQRLGLEVTSTAEAYGKFASAARGTSMEGAAAAKVFESVAGVSAKMGMGVGEQQGVFLALSQMMSKGVVSAEEFRQQLGERLPIATTAGAAAMKVSTAEFTAMLNSGKLISEEFLPKFAEELRKMGGVTGNIDGVQAALNRVSNNFTALKQELGNPASIEGSAKALDYLTSNTKLLAGALTTAATAAGSYAALKLGSTAYEAVTGIFAKSAALNAERAATLAAAEADVTATAATVARQRATVAMAGATAASMAADEAHVAALGRLAAAQSASAASAGIARGAMTLLGGPIGLVTLALTAGVAAWEIWGNSAEKAAKQAEAAMRARIDKDQRNGATEGEATQAEKTRLLEEKKAAEIAFFAAKNVETRAASGRRIREADEQIARLDVRLNEIANTEKATAARNAAATSSEAWAKFHATNKEQRAAELKDLDEKYQAESTKLAGSQDKQLKLAREYQVKRDEINKSFDKKDKAGKVAKDPLTSTDNALEAMQMELVKRGLEANGMAANEAAQRLKVYEVALKGAHAVEQELAAGHLKTAQALQKKVDADVAAAQAAANEVIALDAQVKANKAMEEAHNEAAKLIAQHNLAAKEAIAQNEFLASLDGKSVVELARLNAERRVEIELEKEKLALREKFRDQPAAANEAIAALDAEAPTRKAMAGQTAQVAAQSTLAKQGAAQFDQGGAANDSYKKDLEKQAAYEADRLAKAQGNEALMTQIKAQGAKDREELETQHRAKLVQLAMQGKLSNEQWAKLDASTTLAIGVEGMSKLLGTMATHSKSAFELNKKLALAKAAVSLPSTVMSAYEGGMAAGGPVGPAVGAAYAAIALATGLAQIQAINSASFGGSPSAAPVGSGGLPGQQTITATPYNSSNSAQSQAQQAAQANTHVTVHINALDPASVPAATLQGIADKLTPGIQQAMNRAGQNVVVMV